jgi:hypothetical protein
MTTCDHLKLVLEILLFYLRCKSICSEQKLPYNNSRQYSSYSDKYHKYIQYLSNYNLTLFNIYVDLIEEPVTLPLLLLVPPTSTTDGTSISGSSSFSLTPTNAPSLWVC